MEDDPTGLDAAALVNKSWWDASVTQGPGIDAGPANRRSYRLSGGPVRKYWDYLARHGITYSRNFVRRRKKRFKWTYPKDRIDPNNLKILGN